METKKLCVIGDPVEHSLSPVILQCGLKQTGLPYVYGRVQVRGGETCRLPSPCGRGRVCRLQRYHAPKTDLVELVDELDADAQLYRAVNTVVLRDGKIRGCNTDGRGILQMLLGAGISPGG